MTWHWHEEGFLQPPRITQATTAQHVYRVWGGTATKLGNPSRPGLCLSGQKPMSRRDAERLFSVWEWGNSCLWVTTFELVAGTTLFVGQVHPGEWEAPALTSSGEQIFIEQPVREKVREVATERLRDDLDGGWISDRVGHT